jgi:methionyl-tRNA formyltransferase
MAGDEMTGVTIIQLDEDLDTGPVLTAQAIDIEADENAGQLTERLADLGARLLTDTLTRFLLGDLKPVPQTDEGVTYADKIERKDRPIDLGSDATAVVDRVRGLAPGPAATLTIDGQTHKILAARVTEPGPAPGTWQAVAGKPVVGFGGGAVELITLQPPGKNPQSGAEWVRGRHREGGSVE